MDLLRATLEHLKTENPISLRVQIYHEPKSCEASKSSAHQLPEDQRRFKLSGVTMKLFVSALTLGIFCILHGQGEAWIGAFGPVDFLYVWIDGTDDDPTDNVPVTDPANSSGTNWLDGAPQCVEIQCAIYLSNGMIGSDSPVTSMDSSASMWHSEEDQDH
ncbi:unnamed protein product [Cyprideis torosa]|uniref:Uncharacterized protein n=1 Tax=Cyprideis torosa TaxID=163714 RepID=A0A7R8WFB4_9CRUS|nr:unnamed protein product [Cyprideis torosa]CAG0891277.1 unnamed protein product [Cyprideis torosa]